MGENSSFCRHASLSLPLAQTPLALCWRYKALRFSGGGAGLSVNPSGTPCHLPQQGEPTPHPRWFGRFRRRRNCRRMSAKAEHRERSDQPIVPFVRQKEAKSVDASRVFSQKSLAAPFFIPPLDFFTAKYYNDIATLLGKR